MKTTLENSYYTEIDMIPLLNYRKSLVGKVVYCRKSWSVGCNDLDNEAWGMVYDDYLKTFGLGDKYEEYVDIQIELIEKNLTYAETGSRIVLNDINRLTNELNVMLNSGGKVSEIEDLIVFVIQSGYSIDEKTISAKIFFKMLNNCIKQNGKASKEN